MTSRIYAAAAEEIGEEIAKVVRAGRAAGIPEAVLAHHINKLFDSVLDAFDGDAFETIKKLALEHVGRETAPTSTPTVQAYSRMQ